MRKIFKTQTGITLIELLITGVIVGLVATMAVPRFQIAYERLQYKRANREMTSTLKVARSMAVTSKAQHGVTFNEDNRTVTLFEDVNTGTYAFEEGVDSVLRVDTLPEQFVYLDSDLEGHTIFFRPNGSADFNGGGNIYSMAYSEDVIAYYHANILASTGRVHSDCYYY